MWLDILQIYNFTMVVSSSLLIISIFSQLQRMSTAILNLLMSSLLLSWFRVIHMGKSCVWFGIYSISQFHNNCICFAVNSHYVYASAVDGVFSIAQVVADVLFCLFACIRF